MDQPEKVDKKNPRQDANILSQLFFLWTIPTIFRGAFSGLNQNNLSKCLPADDSKYLGEKLETEWQGELKRATSSNCTPQLKNALFKSFYLSFIVDGMLVFIFTLLKSITPIFLSQLLIQFQTTSILNGNESITERFNLTTQPMINYTKEVEPPHINDGVYSIEYVWNDASWLSTIVVILTFLSCIMNHHMDLRQKMLGAKMRIACSALIYRKLLRMSKRAIAKTSAGNIINLLSNDVNRFDFGFVFVHFIWILPIQACLICYLIWMKAKAAAIVGVVGLLLKTVPIQTGLSKVSSILRMKIALRTDDRVSKMNELIQGIQVIKMYAWEKPFRNVIKLSRKKEVNQIQKAQYIRGIYMSTMVFTERSTLFLAILSCVLEGRPVTADLVFSMATFFNVLQLTAAIFYPLAVSLGAEALVSIKRIQDFLILDEKMMPALSGNSENIVNRKNEGIILKNITASWNNDKNKTLLDICCQMRTGKLCAVIGPVGSGKSSLFQLLLGELPIDSGEMSVPDNISYASQEPWLFSSTIRNNILFGLPFDKLRYTETVKHCALEADFSQLSHGDRTFVGERGMSLSGGQKARVSLARAVYRKASIYLLDDPLSAVDAHVGKHLFTECFGPNSYLSRQKATRVLITHQVHFLKEADWIILIDMGKIIRQGTWNDVMEIPDLHRYISDDSEKNKIKTTDGSSENDDFYDESSDDEIRYIDDEKHKGYVKLKTSESNALSRLSSHSNIDELKLDEQKKNREEDNNEKHMKFIKVLIEYFLAGASVTVLSSIVLYLIFSQFITSGSDYFVTILTNQEQLRINQLDTIFSTYEGLSIYGILIIAVIAVTLSRGFIFFAVCMRSSKKLHDNSFLHLLHSPMRFFDVNPVGRILNRFSKDIGTIDELLPRAIIEAIQILLVMFGILILIGVTTKGYTFLVTLMITVILYGIIIKFYLTPARDLKRLEGINKSPVFGQMTSSLLGITTIRASKMTSQLTIEFDDLQNIHSSIWQILQSINTALGLWLDCISSGFVGLICFSFVIDKEETSSSNAGLAISQALILTGMVQHGIRQIMESFQLFTNAERVLQYTKLEQESIISKQPPQNWPSAGLIEFENVSLSYNINTEPALKDLTFTVESGSKIGVVGRTGAGKSSLINALFKLSNIEGRIIIDGVNTNDINLQILRSKISIIPQDPVLFSATIRYNLDPFVTFTDDEIWKAIETVELKSSVNNLYLNVTEGGSNFSVGQRQLVCLARAVLRSNKIMILDEATANIDQQTDKLIQKTIREKFQGCTVITIAHRLHTVMDSDKILVMENGCAKEFDIPYKLLQNSQGFLKTLVNNLDIEDKQELIEIAKKKYEEML